jgi:hypothetical protein
MSRTRPDYLTVLPRERVSRMGLRPTPRIMLAAKSHTGSRNNSAAEPIEGITDA